MNFVKRTYMRSGLLLFMVAVSWHATAQKVDDIYFHLYTDSLKKGFYNYINVDGKLSDGTWQPLDTTQVQLRANAGHFKGNDLFIDSTYKGETVTVKAALKSNPSIAKEITIYIRKRGFDEPLKTSDQILDEMHTRRNRGRQRST